MIYVSIQRRGKCLDEVDLKHYFIISRFLYRYYKKNDKGNIEYKDLYKNFETIKKKNCYITKCHLSKSFPFAQIRLIGSSFEGDRTLTGLGVSLRLSSGDEALHYDRHSSCRGYTYSFP